MLLGLTIPAKSLILFAKRIPRSLLRGFQAVSKTQPGGENSEIPRSLLRG